MSKLFGRHHTLILYSFMYGPEQDAPCPMCTHLLDSVHGAARHAGQRASLYVVAKSPGRASVGGITFNFSRRSASSPVYHDTALQDLWGRADE
jgi:predicted dithiol-disulfide oxidoreductase (DUF899 family)